MHEGLALLGELALLIAVGAAVAALLSRLKLPTTAGLLVAGALIGPAGLGLVHSMEHIQVVAEVGVVLLLFTIGLELSLDRLRVIARQVAFGGVLQVGLTTAVTVWVARAVGVSLGHAILFGFVFALSSTAIVLRALADRGEIDAPHGRFIMGTLIFQDLCVVPMVLMVPLLADTSDGLPWGAIGLAFGRAAIVVVATLLIARVVVPRMLGWLEASRSREVFLLAVVAICIGTAWLTSLAGLSLALGAFLGGMAVADTEFRHRALGDLLPLRDLFTSVFFVSLGMLFDGRVLLTHTWAVLAALAGFTLAKGLLATVSALLMRFPPRAAWLAGAGLAQFGEFGFVLTTVADRAGVVSHEDVRWLLSAGVISMFLTPLFLTLAPHMTAGERMLRPLARLLGARGVDEIAGEAHPALEDHVVIVGFGIAGRLLARALGRSNVPYVVLELNADTVRKSREAGEPVYYGDASSGEALHHAGAERARCVVLLINDPDGARRAVATARRTAPDTPVMVRTRYVGDRELLTRLGATEVICDEMEAGIEALDRLLSRMGLAPEVREARLDEARDGRLPV